MEDFKRLSKRLSGVTNNEFDAKEPILNYNLMSSNYYVIDSRMDCHVMILFPGLDGAQCLDHIQF